MRVLLIEDTPDVATLITALLKYHKVTWLENRDSEKIESFLPTMDFVISDFDVPGGVFADTKEMCHHYSKPLLLISGDERVGEHEYFLHKLDLMGDLLLKIDEML